MTKVRENFRGLPIKCLYMLWRLFREEFPKLNPIVKSGTALSMPECYFVSSKTGIGKDRFDENHKEARFVPLKGKPDEARVCFIILNEDDKGWLEYDDEQIKEILRREIRAYQKYRIYLGS